MSALGSDVRLDCFLKLPLPRESFGLNSISFPNAVQITTVVCCASAIPENTITLPHVEVGKYYPVCRTRNNCGRTLMVPCITFLVFDFSNCCFDIADFYSERLLLNPTPNMRWEFAFSKGLGFACRETAAVEILYWFLQSGHWVVVFWSTFWRLLPLCLP